jgi:hypothetical protein
MKFLTSLVGLVAALVCSANASAPIEQEGMPPTVNVGDHKVITWSLNQDFVRVLPVIKSGLGPTLC